MTLSDRLTGKYSRGDTKKGSPQDGAELFPQRRLSPARPACFLAFLLHRWWMRDDAVYSSLSLRKAFQAAERTQRWR